MAVTVYTGDCLPIMQSWQPRTFDMVFTSPPYEGQRQYGELKFDLRGQRWVDWMIPRVVEMCRVSRGPVFINMSSPIDRKYTATVEWLVTDLTRHHGVVCPAAPYAWTKNGIPGSGGKRRHRRDWEPIYVFCHRDAQDYYADNKANGTPPKYPPGGAFSNRTKNGGRVNQWGGRKTSGSTRRRNGTRQPPGRPSHQYGGSCPNGYRDGDMLCDRTYVPPTICNAGNVLNVKVGGGRLGSKIAHERNEAPFPTELVRPFIKCFCPPEGVVLDPFGGSGTVAVVAANEGRSAVSIDLRPSQTEATQMRLEMEVSK